MIMNNKSFKRLVGIPQLNNVAAAAPSGMTSVAKLTKAQAKKMLAI